MNKKLWKTAAISALCAVLTVVFLLLGFVCMRLGAKEPEKGMAWVAMLLLLVGAVVSGGTAAWWSDGEMSCVLTSALLYLVAMTLGTLPFGNEFSTWNLFFKLLLPLLAALTTGYLLGKRGINRYKNNRKAAKHAYKMYKGQF